MKRPESIWFEPLDKMNIAEDSGLWFRIPEWIVRAYKIRNSGTNLHKVMFLISEKPISYKKARIKFRTNRTHRYFCENWNKKILKERKAKQ